MHLQTFYFKTSKLQTHLSVQDQATEELNLKSALLPSNENFNHVRISPQDSLTSRAVVVTMTKSSHSTGIETPPRSSLRITDLCLRWSLPLVLAQRKNSTPQWRSYTLTNIGQVLQFPSISSFFLKNNLQKPLFNHSS